MTQLNEADVELKQSMARESAAGKTWRHIVRENADTAIGFLNIDPVQGPGEAILAPRPDGQLDVVFLM